MSFSVRELLKRAQEIVDLERDLSRRMEKSPQEVVELSREYEKIASYIRPSQALLQQNEDLKELSLLEAGEEELERERALLRERAEELHNLLHKVSEQEPKSLVLEVKPGTGGDEASLFAADLFRMYQRYAEFRKWKFQVTRIQPGTRGIKDASALLKGEGIARSMKFEGGVHRVQRVPETEAAGRIHTSTAVVCVLPEAEKTRVVIDRKDLEIRRQRGGGPGGQSVNTTASAISITHKPSGLTVFQQDERSQRQNEEKALAVLQERLQRLHEAQKLEALNNERSSQAKEGDRSDKKRTYNYPQNRITDHERGVTLHKLDRVMEGEEELHKFLESLQEKE